jgi:hypothetical protein
MWEGRMVRTIAIWVFGLLASAIVGDMAGTAWLPSPLPPWTSRPDNMLPGYGYGPFWLTWNIWGMFAGMCAFTCLRLWLAAPRERKEK